MTKKELKKRIDLLEDGIDYLQNFLLGEEVKILGAPIALKGGELNKLRDRIIGIEKHLNLKWVEEEKKENFYKKIK